MGIFLRKHLPATNSHKARPRIVGVGTSLQFALHNAGRNANPQPTPRAPRALHHRRGCDLFPEEINFRGGTIAAPYPTSGLAG